jgi:hypothetical protein
LRGDSIRHPQARRAGLRLSFAPFAWITFTVTAAWDVPGVSGGSVLWIVDSTTTRFREAARHSIHRRFGAPFPVAPDHTY